MNIYKLTKLKVHRRNFHRRPMRRVIDPLDKGLERAFLFLFLLPIFPSRLLLLLLDSIQLLLLLLLLLLLHLKAENFLQLLQRLLLLLTFLPLWAWP